MELPKDKLPRLLLLQMLLLHLLLPLCLGCAEHAQIQRRSVTDLYRDAVRSSLTRVQTVSSLPGSARQPAQYAGTQHNPSHENALPTGQPVSTPPESTIPNPDAIPTPTTDDVKLHLSDSPSLQAALDAASSVNQPDTSVDAVLLASANAPVGSAKSNAAPGVQLASGSRPVKVTWAEDITPLDTTPVAFAQNGQCERISEYFEETELREAIDILAGMTGDKVIVDESVKRLAAKRRLAQKRKRAQVG